ncbi:MAG: hypothetical protein AB7E21_17350, partial [Pseudodonghicola sp.]
MFIGRLKIWIWSALVLAMVVFISGRLIESARIHVTESTLTTAASTEARSWYSHYVLHEKTFLDLLGQDGNLSVHPLLRHDADVFGNVQLYRIYDRHGRLVLSSANTQAQDQNRQQSISFPGGSGQKGIERILSGTPEITEISDV